MERHDRDTKSTLFFLLTILTLSMTLATACDDSTVASKTGTEQPDATRDTHTLPLQECPLEVRAYQSRSGQASEPLIGQLLQRSPELLTCANQNLWATSASREAVIRLQTRYCDGTLVDDAAGRHGSNDLDRFAACALDALGHDFPQLPRSSWGLPCQASGTEGGGLGFGRIRLGWRPGVYELIIPEEACHFTQVDVGLWPWDSSHPGGIIGRKNAPRIKPIMTLGEPSMSESCQESVRRVFAAKTNALKYCYEKELQLDPKLRGSLTVSLNVSSEGSAENVQVRESTLDSQKVEECVERVVSRMRFKRQQHQCTVSYPVDYTSDQPE